MSIAIVLGVVCSFFCLVIILGAMFYLYTKGIGFDTVGLAVCSWNDLVGVWKTRNNWGVISKLEISADGDNYSISSGSIKLAVKVEKDLIMVTGETEPVGSVSELSDGRKVISLIPKSLKPLCTVCPVDKFLVYYKTGC